MPTTINGIGTHYYGKKNLSVRTAACHSCQRVGPLESYDTRLWFVIVFIPVIPLGRKRIIDKCPSCTRHFAAGADAYAQSKRLQIVESQELFDRAPSPESALLAHGLLVAFHERLHAAEFRTQALQKFPDHVGMRIGMAHQLREASSYDESAQLFKDALDLDPNDHEARAGVAVRKVTEGELDEAHRLLIFLEEPGAGQRHSLVPIDVLAGAYQKVRRHEEALQLAAVLLRELPNLGGDHAFRSFVRKSEKALGRTESILPPRDFSLRGLFRSEGSAYAPWQRFSAIGALVLALLAIGLGISNEYIRRNRTIHVVNACGSPAQISVDDEPPIAVDGLGLLSVAEGTHTIKVSGPVEETHTVNVESSYFDRWFNKPAWVLNPGAEAVLEEQDHVYSETPQPGKQRLIVGKAFFSAPDYDYIFEKAPQQVSVKNKSTVVHKTELNWLKAQDVDAFYSAVNDNHKAGMDFAERRLRRNANQKELLNAYLARANDADRPHVKDFLQSGLDKRPINVSWHRAYQSLGEFDMPEGDLIALYDKYLAAEPLSGALLYLRGRIDPSWDKQAPFFRRAIDADPQLAWPWIALASQAASWARWDECLAAARKAKALPMDDPALLNDLLHTARLAKGEAATLVNEYRALLAANTIDLVTLLYLTEALAVAGKANEIDSAISNWEVRVPAQVRPQLAPALRLFALYQAGKVKDSEALCNANPLLLTSAPRAAALLARGDAKSAADDPRLAKVWDDPWDALALSLAFRINGKTDDASRWSAKAIEKFNAGRSDQKLLAKVVSATEAPSLESLSRLYAHPSEKALLLAALAARFPAKQGEYLAVAGKLNVRRKPHQLLIKLVIDRKTAAKP